MKYLLLLLASCATVPVVTPPKPYVSWPNQEWAQAAEKAVVATGLDKLELGDEKQFCPNGLGVRNWVHLMAGVVTYESNFKPATEYKEAFNSSNGQRVISTGLFHISISSTQQARYGCKWGSQAELRDPIKNIECSAKVISALVRENGVVTNHSGTSYRGMARYWSVMRPSGKLSQIKAKMKAWCE